MDGVEADHVYVLLHGLNFLLDLQEIGYFVDLDDLETAEDDREDDQRNGRQQIFEEDHYYCGFREYLGFFAGG